MNELNRKIVERQYDTDRYAILLCNQSPDGYDRGGPQDLKEYFLEI